MELPDLLRRCREGDALAWEALVRQFQGRVYGLAFFYLGEAEEARDLAQDVFVRLYRNLDRCTDDDTFVPWLIQITRNAAVDRLRRLMARPHRRGISLEAARDLVAATPGPHEEMLRRRRRDLVRRALGRLSVLSREIILLREIQGLSLETIASLVKAPVGTVKSRSHRARGELARVLAAMLKDEPGVGP
jgi:RNA polymerase sigma-70 factor (ECF subfamily)